MTSVSILRRLRTQAVVDPAGAERELHNLLTPQRGRPPAIQPATVTFKHLTKRERRLLRATWIDDHDSSRPHCHPAAT